MCANEDCTAYAVLVTDAEGEIIQRYVERNHNHVLDQWIVEPIQTWSFETLGIQGPVDVPRNGVPNFDQADQPPNARLPGPPNRHEEAEPSGLAR